MSIGRVKLLEGEPSFFASFFTGSDAEGTVARNGPTRSLPAKQPKLFAADE